MRVISKINNSAILCQDDNGDEVVAFGKGIGFCKIGSAVDLGRVQRTFYGLDHQSASLLRKSTLRFSRWRAVPLIWFEII